MAGKPHKCMQRREGSRVNKRGTGFVQSGDASIADKAILAVKNLFLPAFCRKCGKRILTEENLYFCIGCWATIELVRDPKCPRCGRPHPGRIGFEPVDNFVCSDCSKRKLRVDRTFAAGLYVGVLRDAIHLLKYGKKRMLAGPLAQLLFEACVANVDFGSYDMLVPVPLHWNRLRERGFNQSRLIGGHLCRLHGALSLAPVLERVKDTPSFSMLGASERRDLIQKAFQVDARADVATKRILLIDDVVTTGATSNECAKILKKKGAAVVDVIALAVVGRL